MDMETLLAGRLSKEQCTQLVEYIGNDPERFGRLMELFFKGNNRVVQNAAWPMSYSAQLHPALIKPYIGRLIRLLSKKGLHPALPRNIVRLLQFTEIPPRYHGTVIDTCFKLVGDPAVPVAIKAFSLTILETLAQQYPDIKTELRLVIEERLPHESAAFKSRAQKILQKL